MFAEHHHGVLECQEHLGARITSWLLVVCMFEMHDSLPETVTLPCATGTRQRLKNTRQTAHDIYSVGKQLFAECFLSRTRQMVCRVSNLTLSKKSGFSSVFPKYTRQRIIVCRVFLGITLDKPIFQRKKIIFFSAYHYYLPSVFENYTRQTYFPKKKIIFFSQHILV